MLHGCLIPYDQVCLTDQSREVGVFVDVAKRVLMNGNGDFEAGMSSATTFKKKCCNARGSHTKNNFALGAQVVAKGIVKIGLACATSTLNKKDLPCSVGNCSRDSVKGRVLIRIKIGNLLFSKISLVQQIILPLLCNKRIEILNKGAPIPYNLWHAVPILKAFSSLNEKLVNEIKAIVMYVLL